MIEVYLISNDSDAKIFYYTDGIGRFDTLKEFKSTSPILLQKNTSLQYYAINDLNSSTPIQENIYTFHYPKNLSLSANKNNIIIKNNELKTINIWWYFLEWNILKYQIQKNTFLSAWETFILDYNMKVGEKILLFAPDTSLIESFLLNEPTPSIQEKIFTQEEIWNAENSTQIQILQIPEETPLTEEISISQTDKNPPLPQQTSWNWADLKTSAFDISSPEKNNITSLLYIFFILIGVVSVYNIYTVISQNRTKRKNKRKKL